MDSYSDLFWTTIVFCSPFLTFGIILLLLYFFG